jgi:hypothetical protein
MRGFDGEGYGTLAFERDPLGVRRCPAMLVAMQTSPGFSETDLSNVRTRLAGGAT